MNKKTLRALSLIGGAAAMMNTAASADVSVNGGVLVESEAAAYDKIANIEGGFRFNQDVISPADEIFNIFGTVTTGMCAKPNFAFGEIEKADLYVNVCGKIAKEYTVSLKDMTAQERDMVCSCSMGSSFAQTTITGVPVADILQLADLDADANTIAFVSSDGYRRPMPLKYVLDHGAVLAYKVGGEEIPTGAQVWMPGTVTNYFTRDVVDIEVTAQQQVPEVEAMPDEQRAKVSILNRAEGEFAVGDQIAFEGYADDCGVAIAAVEFSLDGGETWTACETPETNAQKWVYWNFAIEAKQEGFFRLDVRARAADGTVSPLASSVTFTVGKAL